jgi:hypothetical protein
MPKNLVPFTQAEEKFIEKMIEKRDRAEVRFPLITALAVTFGFVSVLYGFEKMIDRVDLFVNHPWILLIIGLVILAITGSIYKKLN